MKFNYYNQEEEKSFGILGELKGNTSGINQFTQLRTSLELLINVICLRESITTFSMETAADGKSIRKYYDLQQLIHLLCNSTPPIIPQEIWNIPKPGYQDNNFLHDIRNEGNIDTHTANEKSDRYLRNLLCDYENRFIKWYAEKYKIDNWKSFIETTIPKTENASISIDISGRGAIVNANEATVKLNFEKSEAVTVKESFYEPTLNGVYINSDFWEQYKISDSEINEDLKGFYITPALSRGNMIEKVVANNFYISPNASLEIEEQSPENGTYETIESVFSKFEEKHSFKCLIKVTGLGGSGKTTFLWHLAKKFYVEYSTFFLEDFDKGSIAAMRQYAKEDEAILILIDSVYEASKEANLKVFFRELKAFQKVFFVVAERSSWLESMRNRDIFYSSFGYEFEINFTGSLDRNEIFRKLITLLPDDYQSKASKIPFQVSSSLSLVVQKYKFLKEIKLAAPKLIFKFDWDDWEKFINENCEYLSLKYLYLFIAAFQHLGQNVPANLNFNIVFDNANILSNLIIEAIQKFGDDSCPILFKKIENKDFLVISDDTLCEIMINELSDSQKGILGNLLDNFFNSIKDTESCYIFRNINRVKSFQESSVFKKYLTYDNRIKTLSQYLEGIPKEKYTRNEDKCIAELIKTYEEKRDEYNMLLWINELIEREKDTGRDYGIHMLADFYINFNKAEKYGEAVGLLNELGKIPKNIGLVLSSFRRLYPKYPELLEKVSSEWKEKITENPIEASEEARIKMARAEILLQEGNVNDAILIYKSIITTNEKDVQSRTKLSSILRKKAQKARDSLGKKDWSNRRKLLGEALELSLEALKVNPQDEHVYTELGELYYCLGAEDDQLKAIEYLIMGINNCTNNIGCKTSLGKIYRRIAVDWDRKKDFKKALSFLDLSYRLLKDAKVHYPDHQASSIELSITCMKLFEQYKRENINPDLQAFYRIEIKDTLYPTFLDQNQVIVSKNQVENGIRLLLSFYRKHNFLEDYKNLTEKILSSKEPHKRFWFSLLDCLKEEEYITTLFIKIIPTINDNKDIEIIINKLLNPRFNISNISEPLQKALEQLKSNNNQYKKGSFILALYNYAVGSLKDCKEVINKYVQNSSKDIQLAVWQEFLKIVSESSIYINLLGEGKEDYSKPKFYFDQAWDQKGKLSNVFPNNKNPGRGIKDEIGIQKKLLEWYYGLSYLKSLNETHKDRFGFGCFYIWLFIGEIYHRTRIPEITDEYRLNMAKHYYTSAYLLIRNGKFPYSGQSLISGHENDEWEFYSLNKDSTLRYRKVKRSDIPGFFIERLMNDMVDCYLSQNYFTNDSSFLEKGFNTIEYLKIKKNFVLYNLLVSELLTRKKEYKRAYDCCNAALQIIKNKEGKNMPLNLLLFRNSDEIKGRLLANLAYAVHKNWVENKKLIKEEYLFSIKEKYVLAHDLWQETWITDKIKMIDQEINNLRKG